MSVAVSVDDRALTIRHKAKKPPEHLVKVLDELLASPSIGPALAISLTEKPRSAVLGRILPRAAVKAIASPARSPDTKPFRWQVSNVGYVWSERTSALAQRALDKSDRATESQVPTRFRSVRVFPMSAPDLVLQPEKLKAIAEAITIECGKSTVFPFDYNDATSAPYVEGRVWRLGADPQRAHALGSDGSVCYREALWEDAFPKSHGLLRGDEFGGCSVFELMFKATRYMQRLLSSFSKPVTRYELIVHLAGIQKRRLLCDPAEPGSLRGEPLVASSTCVEPAFTAGTTFASDLSESELLSMCADLLVQIANIFDASSMLDAIVKQAKVNLGLR